MAQTAVLSVLALLPILWLVTVCALMTGLGRIKKTLMRGGTSNGTFPNQSQQLTTSGPGRSLGNQVILNEPKFEESIALRGSEQMARNTGPSEIDDRAGGGLDQLQSHQPSAEANTLPSAKLESLQKICETHTQQITTPDKSAEVGRQEAATVASKGGIGLCPYCAEEIKSAAVKCKHCGEWLHKGKD